MGMPEQVIDDIDAAEEVITCEICGLSDPNTEEGWWSPHTTDMHPCDVCGGNGHSDEDHRWCEACDEYVPNGHEGLCDDCGCHVGDCQCDEDGEVEDGENIHNYNYQPGIIRYEGMVNGERTTAAQVGLNHVAHRYPEPPDTQRYLGLEVECEGVEGTPREIAQAWNSFDLGWSKSDGSLRHGVECVTHPVTYERLEADGSLSDAIKAMRRAGGRAWEPGNCGLHIHISRPSFNGKSHQWRFAAAHEAMSVELRKMSGRVRRDSYDSGEGYCKWEGSTARELHRNGTAVYLPADERQQEREAAATVRYASYAEEDADYERRRAERDNRRRSWVHVPQKATKIVAGKQVVGDRYVSVNVTEGTIELRFWRGSLAPEHVLGAAAMVDGIAQWTHTMSVQEVRAVITRKSATGAKGGSLAWRAFQAWAQENLPAQQCERIVTLAVRRKVPVAAGLVRAAHAAKEVKA
jgi:hypothetical protein